MHVQPHLLRMMFPTINTRSMNVELTEEHYSLITKKLAPLARLVSDEKGVQFDIVLRKIHKKWSGERYCISVRMSTATQKYYAITTERYFAKAFSSIREDLRKSISKSYKAEERSASRMQRFIRERQYLELFA